MSTNSSSSTEGNYAYVSGAGDSVNVPNGNYKWNQILVYGNDGPGGFPIFGYRSTRWEIRSGTGTSLPEPYPNLYYYSEDVPITTPPFGLTWYTGVDGTAPPPSIVRDYRTSGSTNVTTSSTSSTRSTATSSSSSSGSFSSASSP
jgi:hypothetical protein